MLSAYSKRGKDIILNLKMSSRASLEIIDLIRRNSRLLLNFRSQEPKKSSGNGYLRKNQNDKISQDQIFFSKSYKVVNSRLHRKACFIPKKQFKFPWDKRKRESNLSITQHSILIFQFLNHLSTGHRLPTIFAECTEKIIGTRRENIRQTYTEQRGTTSCRTIATHIGEIERRADFFSLLELGTVYVSLLLFVWTEFGRSFILLGSSRRQYPDLRSQLWM